MRTHSLSVFPIFPQWVFDGQVHLSDEILEIVKDDVAQLPAANHYFGYVSKSNEISLSMQKLRRVVGNIFYDNANAHYDIPEGWNNIESVNARIVRIEPGHAFPTQMMIRRWYQALVVLQVDTLNPPTLRFENYNNVINTVPQPLIQRYHEIPLELLRALFWPSNLPWSITVNQGSKPLVVLVNDFIIKPSNQFKPNGSVQ
jgi:hypothetical protein